jgi:hypothetical protein
MSNQENLLMNRVKQTGEKRAFFFLLVFFPLLFHPSSTSLKQPERQFLHKENSMRARGKGKANS